MKEALNNKIKKVIALPKEKHINPTIIKILIQQVNLMNNPKYDTCPLYEYFIYSDFQENYKGLDKLFDLCFMYDISAIEYLRLEIFMYQNAFKALDKGLKLHLMDKNHISTEDLFLIVEENYINIVTDERTEIEDFKHFDDNLKINILNITFKEAQKDIINNKFFKNITLKSVLYNYSLNDDLIDDMRHHLDMIKSKLTNKKVLAKVENSYLSKIVLDSLEYSEEYKGFYFKNYKDGISLGYSERAFLLSVDKDKAIRELEAKIEMLKSYNLKESETLINMTLDLINLVKQKKHNEKIPFKTIGKKLNMNVNEAKNFIKALTNLSFNNKTFTNFYEVA